MLRINNKLCFGGLCWLLLGASVLASEQFPLIFNPQVTVYKGGTGGAGVEIVADNSNFIALYSSYLSSFRPLDIPFLVRTIDGVDQNYVIKLKESQHYCQIKGEPAESLVGVKVTLDSNPVLQNGVSFFGKENQHNMQVIFPFVDIKGVEQSCYGTLVLIAEVIN